MGRKEFIAGLRNTPSKRDFYASKGTAKRSKAKQTKAMKTKIAALVAAGLIVLGACSIQKDNEPVNISEIETQGIDANALGLSDETLLQFKMYDDYFEHNTESAMGEEDLRLMASEIKDLDFAVIKEKVGNALGIEEPLDSELAYRFEDGQTFTHIITYPDSYNEKTYTRISGLTGDKDFSEEISEQILSLQQFDRIDEYIEDGNFEKGKFLLEEVYNGISDFAASEISYENGKIVYKGFENAKEQAQGERD